MPKIKSEVDSPKVSNPIDSADDELDERFELAFVEESAGDDVDANFLSSPNSPQYGDGCEDEPAVDLNMEEEMASDERKKREFVESDEEEEVGPKTPPDGEVDAKEENGENRSNISKYRGTKRRHSSARSHSKDSSSSHSRDGSDSTRNSSLYRDGESSKNEDERNRQNKHSRLIRLRDARPRQPGHEYIPSLASKSRPFPPQPYFKNPSFYPGGQRDRTRPLPPPPPAQKIAPLPGGRLPLVQRRSSPAPFESNSRQRQRSPAAAPPPIRRRRTIVEDTIRVTAKRSPSPRRHRSPSFSNRNSRSSKDFLGPQTLYPSRRDPYPPPRPNGRDYHDRRPSSYKNNSYSSSESNGSSSYIFTGSKYVPRPFIPPPPPGKKWNCPRREGGGEKKWNYAKRE